MLLLVIPQHFILPSYSTFPTSCTCLLGSRKARTIICLDHHCIPQCLVWCLEQCRYSVNTGWMIQWINELRWNLNHASCILQEFYPHATNKHLRWSSTTPSAVLVFSRDRTEAQRITRILTPGGTSHDQRWMLCSQVNRTSPRAWELYWPWTIMWALHLMSRSFYKSFNFS